MMTARVLAFIITFLGFMYGVLSLTVSLTDVGIGMAISAAGVVGWGLLAWVEER